MVHNVNRKPAESEAINLRVILGTEKNNSEEHHSVCLQSYIYVSRNNI